MCVSGCDAGDNGMFQPAGADEECPCEGGGGCAAGGQIQESEEVEGTGEIVCLLEFLS